MAGHSKRPRVLVDLALSEEDVIDKFTAHTHSDEEQNDSQLQDPKMIILFMMIMKVQTGRGNYRQTGPLSMNFWGSKMDSTNVLLKILQMTQNMEIILCCFFG
jgi:hypothetical protein